MKRYGFEQYFYGKRWRMQQKIIQKNQSFLAEAFIWSPKTCHITTAGSANNDRHSHMAMFNYIFTFLFVYKFKKCHQWFQTFIKKQPKLFQKKNLQRSGEKKNTLICYWRKKPINIIEISTLFNTSFIIMTVCVCNRAVAKFTAVNHCSALQCTGRGVNSNWAKNVTFWGNVLHATFFMRFEQNI